MSSYMVIALSFILGPLIVAALFWFINTIEEWLS